MTKQKFLQNGEKTTSESGRKKILKEQQQKRRMMKKMMAQYLNKRSIKMVEEKKFATQRWINSKLQQEVR